MKRELIPAQIRKDYCTTCTFYDRENDERSRNGYRIGCDFRAPNFSFDLIKNNMECKKYVLYYEMREQGIRDART